MNGVLAGVCLIVVLGLARVHCDPIACDPDQRPNVLSGPIGTFVSLNYPFNYPNNANCQWQIIAEPGHVVKIDFTEFNTERGYDIVWFFDGDSLLSPGLLGVSGDRTPAPGNIVGTVNGGSLYIQFTSDANTNAVGFNATYTSVLENEVTGACNALSRPVQLTGLTGVFTSLYFPDPYPFLCECQWLITSEDVNGYVQLDFTTFNTQSNADWVRIYDGNSQSGALIARLSGQFTPAPTGFVSTQRYMFVIFTSDEQISIQGWRATYRSVAPTQ